MSGPLSVWPGTLRAMTFKPGDHIRVRRPLGYDHHGIFVSEDRVIQFGAGLNLLREKVRAGITVTTLKDFEKDGIAEVVEHGRHTGLTGWLPEADEPWKIVARAEFLLELQPKTPYHLIGHNCEHFANLCVAGHLESHQVRSAFGLDVMLRGIGILRFAYLSRTKQPIPRWLANTLLVSTVVGIGAVMLYNQGIKNSWEEIREHWLAHERELSEQEPPEEDSAA